MKYFRLTSLFLSFVPSLLHADLAGMKTVLQGWEAENRDWEAAYEYASPERREELLKSRPNDETAARELWRQVQPVLNSPEALPAVIWLLEHSDAVSKAFDREIGKQIGNALIEALQGDAVTRKGVGRVSSSLCSSTNPQCRYILEQIRAKNPNAVDQGLAAMGLALMINENQGIRRDDPRMNAVRLKYIREAIIKAFDEPFGGKKVSDFATDLLYEINNLHVRRKAPSFELTAEDGSKVKVPNDEKHTLLIFWTPNVPASHSFAAMAQDLGAKYPNLTVVPVCPELKSRKGVEVKNALFDSPKGDTFRLYRIREAPWVCLIDKGGVVRMRGVPDSMFSTLFDEMMKTIDAPSVRSDTKPNSSTSAPAASAQGGKPGDQAGAKLKPSIPAESGESQGGGMTPPPLKPIPMD